MRGRAKKARRFYWVILIILLLSVSILSFKHLKGQKKIDNTETTVSNELKQDVPTVDTTNNSDTKESAKSIESIPILMYHYVRDYTDSSDPIGVNLSVSPQKFAKQLDLLKADGYTTITFKDLLSNNLPVKPIILSFDDGYKDFYQNAFPLFKERQMKAVSFVIADFVGRDQYMNNSEIKVLDEYGIEIGSHTLSHPDLTKISSDKANEEIVKSKAVLEQIIGKSIVSFCYPSGKFNDATEADVEKAGYSYAVTTQSGLAKLASPFALTRYRMNADTNISNFIK